jgi:hypothetical protein
MCIDAQRNAHMSIQVQRKHSGLPCAMALRLIRALPGESELLATIAPERRWPLKDLTPAIRASGPHDFAVREPAHSSTRRLRPPQPVPTSVTWPTSPLAGQDGRNKPVIWVRSQIYFRKSESRFLFPSPVRGRGDEAVLQDGYRFAPPILRTTRFARAVTVR